MHITIPIWLLYVTIVGAAIFGFLVAALIGRSDTRRIEERCRQCNIRNKLNSIPLNNGG